MTFKKNVLATYSSQIYIALIGIFMVPQYIKYMGIEAYGLVGFYVMVQTWFTLLDIGLTPTMARETAQFNGGAISSLSLRRLLRSMEGVFICVGIFGGSIVIYFSQDIASNWLKIENLSIAEVRESIILMAFIVALRWVCGLYRSAVSGFERLVWLSGFSIVIATLRFVLVVPYFIYVGADAVTFFTYQLSIALIELIVLTVKTYRIFPKIHEGKRTPWRWDPLRKVLKFSLSIALTSSIWVLITQTDKLVLSKLLPLSEYAYFTMAVLLASGVMIISGPISGPLLPRMSKLSAEKNDESLFILYRNATQLVGITAIPSALVLAIFSKQILWLWTGDSNIVLNVSPILALYALGNGLLAVSAFPYYLQFSKGDLKLHMIGNLIFVVLLIPALIWLGINYGAIGAGWAWLISNAVYFFCWVPKVHNRFIKGFHLPWLLIDVSPIILISLAGAFLAKFIVIWSQNRVVLAWEILALGLFMVLLAALGSSFFRGVALRMLYAKFSNKNV